MIRWKTALLGATAFLAAHVVESAAWTTWFRGVYAPWFLKLGRAVAFTAGLLLIIGLVVGVTTVARRESMVAAGELPAGAAAAMIAVLFCGRTGHALSSRDRHRRRGARREQRGRRLRRLGASPGILAFVACLTRRRRLRVSCGPPRVPRLRRSCTHDTPALRPAILDPPGTRIVPLPVSDGRAILDDRDFYFSSMEQATEVPLKRRRFNARHRAWGADGSVRRLDMPVEYSASLPSTWRCVPAPALFDVAHGAIEIAARTHLPRFSEIGLRKVADVAAIDACSTSCHAQHRTRSWTEGRHRENADRMTGEACSGRWKC